MVHTDVLADLSVLPGKVRRYREEVFSREVWQDFETVVGERSRELLHLHGMVLFKPDGIVGGVLDKALEILRNLHFEPVGGAIVQLDRHMTRWLWLYRFNSASIERVWLHDRINCAGPSLLVVLRDELAIPGHSIPAAVRLTDCKGPSRPERRRPDQLRTRLGVDDRLLNFVHTSDEPADVVRELGILLTPQERRLLLRRVMARESWEEWFATHRTALEAEPRSFDPAVTISNLERTAKEMQLAARSESARRLWAGIARSAAAATADDETATAELWRLIKPVADNVDAWDVVCLGAREIQFDEPGVERQTLGDAPPAKWLASRSS
jgi:Nucleoside diphosphate kinase